MTGRWPRVVPAPHRSAAASPAPRTGTARPAAPRWRPGEPGPVTAAVPGGPARPGRIRAPGLHGHGPREHDAQNPATAADRADDRDGLAARHLLLAVPGG